MNGVCIAATGRVGTDPEERYTSGGKRMLSFSMIVDESYTATEQRAAPEPIWLRCTAWEDLAATLIEQLRKGASVYVEGKLQHRRWETQQGEPRCGLSVSCSRVDVHGQIGRRAPKPAGRVSAS